MLRVFVVDVDFVCEGREAPEAAIGIEPRELVRIGEGKRAEQECVDDAEDGDVGADTQSKNKDGNGGEGAVSPERAQRITNVAKKRVEEGKTAGFAMRFL